MTMVVFRSTNRNKAVTLTGVASEPREKEYDSPASHSDADQIQRPASCPIITPIPQDHPHVHRQDLSTSFFMNSWMANIHLGESKVYYDVVVELIAKSPPSSSIYRSFLATAAAHLASYDCSKQHQVYARTTYVSALAAVQASLADPVERLQDTTLAAVFLFSTLEVGKLCI